MSNDGKRTPYQRPQARLVMVKPEERLMSCKKASTDAPPCASPQQLS